MVRFRALTVLALVLGNHLACSQNLIFSDPFTFTAGTPGASVTDHNLGIPARQSAGTLGSTYTKTTSGHAGNTIYLQDNISRFGPSDAINFRTQRSAGASQTAADFDTNFGTVLAGRTWELDFDSYHARNNNAISDAWFAVSIGDTTAGGAEVGVRGPNHPSADFAILIRGDGRFTAWTDNVPWTGNASPSAIWAKVFHLKLIVDEFKAAPDVTALFTIDGNTTTLGTWPVTWDNNDERLIELRDHQGGGTGTGLMDVRLDNLTLTVTQDLDGPPLLIAPVTAQELWTGDPLALSVQAAGVEPRSYQWKLDGNDLPGATNASYEIRDANLSDSGLYEVVVSNPFGSITSGAQVRVIVPTPEQRSYEPIGPSSRRAGVLVSEILYHPAPDPIIRELEFVELYNSEPWPTDLSGWRLSGDLDFNFAPGTTIAAHGYLVVARVPADLQSATGLTGVLGPFTGNLPNDGGRVRLRKPSGAIVWQVDYNDRHPWPLAADGTGHSLVLARPSSGESDPQAWSASHSMGGSPGARDPVPGDDVDHLVINEVLANSDLPRTDFIEIYNPSPLTVSLEGCTLSDERNTLNKYQFPPGASIGPRRFVALEEATLGFALNANGETIFLTNADSTRVLDAASYPASDADTSLGLFPDGVGSGRLQALEALTPELANARPLLPEIIINEVFFHAPLTHPGGGDWIELHNRSLRSLSLDGWTFTNGLQFIFPPNTNLAAGDYLVVAQDRTQLLANHPAVNPDAVFGDFAGSLGNGGDRIALAKPDPNGGGFFIEVDTLDFRDQTAFSKWADGRGSSLERRDADAPGQLVSNWADSDESGKAPWTTVEITGTLAHGNTGVNPAQAVQFLLLGDGEVLVDSVEVIPRGGPDLAINGSFENGATGWSFDGNHRDSVVESGVGFAGSNALRLVSHGRGDPLANRVRAALSGPIAVGTRATIRARVRWLKGHPEFDLRLKGGWLETAQALVVPANLGTPAAPNSRALANSAPEVREVSHRPVLPPAGAPFRVFARVSDPDGIQSVTLRYRLDPSNTFSSRPMVDDGLNGDLLAGDGLFTGRLPSQNAGTLVGFFIEAVDNNGSPATFPQEPAANGPECLVHIGETSPDGPFASYRFWITQATLADWIATPFLSNEPFPATIVYDDRRVLHNSGAYYAGARDSNNSPLGTLTGYDLVLPDGELVLGADKLTIDLPIRDVTNQREQLMYHFLDLLRLPSLHRRDFQLFVNGQRRGTLYHDAEQPDSVVVASHFPGDKGHLYKLNNDREGTDAGVRITPFRRPQLDVFEADGQIQFSRYFWNFGPRARGADTRINLAPIFELATAADSTLPSHESDLAALVDIENWMRTFAMNDLASFWDGFGNPNYKNTYLYKPEATGWVLFSWDFDVGLGVFNDPVNAALFPSNVDPNVRRIYNVPSFIRAYWGAIDEALDDWFTGAAVTPWLQARFEAYQAAGLSITSPFVPSGTGLSIPAWIDQRRSFLLGEFAGLDAPLAVTHPTTGSSSSDATITLSGRAPVATSTIEVNGFPLPLSWTTVTNWSGEVTLVPGANTLVIRALDHTGSEVASEAIEVAFTGTATWAPLVLNEWMADNATTIADPADGQFEDWIEIYNPSALNVDLEGWSLTDDPALPGQFIIPAGFSIPPFGYLLAWADAEAFQNDPATRPDLHLNFKLSSNGEAIILHAPDGTEIDLVTFGPAAEDFSMGVPDGGAPPDRGILVTATPTGANSASPTTMNPTLTREGSGFDLTISTSPGFTYALEASQDLVTWQPFGSPVIATGDPLTFSFPLTAAPRFFVRATRTP